MTYMPVGTWAVLGLCTGIVCVLVLICTRILSEDLEAIAKELKRLK